jgi:hypothetical protein
MTKNYDPIDPRLTPILPVLEIQRLKVKTQCIASLQTNECKRKLKYEQFK